MAEIAGDIVELKLDTISAAAAESSAKEVYKLALRHDVRLSKHFQILGPVLRLRA